MGGIFISHSSANNAEAERLKDWLASQGWGAAQVFLDTHDLKAGDRWRDVLDAMADKEAVIVCLSDQWLSSHECVREFTQAQERGKPIFPVFVARVSQPIPRFITDLQIGDISELGIAKLRNGLISHRITPQSFPWPPKDDVNRSVYRGLKALDVEDAAIFFGRDADIARGLDELRQMRNGARERVLVILGASGAGKSSFLRAGLLARLKRDEENFLVLPPIRPERAVLSGKNGLHSALSQMSGGNESGGDAETLSRTFATLREEVAIRLALNTQNPTVPRPPTIVVSIDQGEELFSPANDEAASFSDLLAQTIERDDNVLVVATIRSDAYHLFQDGLLPARQRLFTLPSVPVGTFQEIITGPARLSRPPLELEPALVDQLLKDLSATDALPLLGFTLERLKTSAGQDGKLSLSEYRDGLGGLSGSIRSAIAKVLGEAPDPQTLARAKRLFIPALIQVDATGAKRRKAQLKELDDDVIALAEQFTAERLLVRDGDTLEIAHEAILRHWSALSGWIAESYAALAVLAGVRTAAADWRSRSASNPKRAQSWLLHRGQRLKDATALTKRRDFASLIDADMTGYLAACAREDRRAAGVKTQLRVAGFALVLLVGAAGYGYSQRETLEPIAISWTKFRPFVVRDPQLHAASVGASFQDCRAGTGDCPEMVILPEGDFLMGAPDSDTKAAADQRPQRTIHVPRVAVSRYEVTFAEWRACVAARGCRAYVPDSAGWPGDQRPVMRVSWQDAAAYASWLSRMTGEDYRLLTEAEWEYGARGVTGNAPAATFTWGEQAPVCTPGAANGATFYGCEAHQTTPVGAYRANRFGLFDMHGNVWEWVDDCYAPYDAEQRGAAPVTAASCQYRVVRGGAWNSNPLGLQSAFRRRMPPDFRGPGVGFRVARTISGGGA